MTDKKINLVVVEPNNSGGLVHFSYQLSNALANEGVDITLLTGTDYEMSAQPHNFQITKLMKLWENFDPDSSDTKIQQNPLKRIWRKGYWNTRRILRGVRLFHAWVSLTVYLFRKHPDIVQFTRIRFPFEAFFVKYMRKRGLILTQICHEFEHRENFKSSLSVLERLSGNIYENFSAIFFLSTDVRNNFLKVFPSTQAGRTHVIPHGNSGWLLNLPAVSDVILRKRYGLVSNERVVLFFGLLSPSKGLDDLLDAFVMVRDRSDSKLIVAGYPTKRMNMNELMEKVDKLGIADRVIFDPRYIPLDEIRPLMNIASVVVYPYRSGTQSGALQTAYTFGRPVIVTSVGGLPEVVEDGKSGFVVPPRSPYDLAEKIIAIINNPEKAEEMGKYALYLSETRFSWEPIAMRIAGVYEHLVDAKKGQGIS